MPYLTLWDKISQNLEGLEAYSPKFLQISQNFQTILQHILWRNKYTSHFVVYHKLHTLKQVAQRATITHLSPMCQCKTSFKKNGSDQ